MNESAWLRRSPFQARVGALVAASMVPIGIVGCEADAVSPGRSSPEASVASDGSPSDVTAGDAAIASPADASAGADAGVTTPAYGDRNLGLIEPYPDALLIQNGGRFYNLKKPPTAGEQAAVGDGVTDDTAAFEDAFDFLRTKLLAATGVPGSKNLEVPNSQAARDVDSFWLYVPDGTYRVSDTLIYRGEGLEAYYKSVYDGGMPFGTPWFDLSRVRIVGQSRERAIIELADHAAGFDDPGHPKPVVTLQHPTTTFNDWNADNLVTNLTVDTGSGNPGAVGILAQGAK